jgi:hypothetical protein
MTEHTQEGTMSDHDKDPISGSTKQKGGDPADRWVNEGGAPEKKDPKTPAIDAGTPRTGEGTKYEEDEGSAQERSEKEQR